MKKKQSLIALCCKLIRVLFKVGKQQVAFSPEKMLRDIPYFRLQRAAIYGKHKIDVEPLIGFLRTNLRFTWMSVRGKA